MDYGDKVPREIQLVSDALWRLPLIAGHKPARLYDLGTRCYIETLFGGAYYMVTMAIGGTPEDATCSLTFGYSNAAERIVHMPLLHLSFCDGVWKVSTSAPERLERWKLTEARLMIDLFGGARDAVKDEPLSQQSATEAAAAVGEFIAYLS